MAASLLAADKTMDFEHDQKTRGLIKQVSTFLREQIIPAEPVFYSQLEQQDNRWRTPDIMAELQSRARHKGLWNLFLPESTNGAGLKNIQYAPLCEIMGRSPIAPEVFNCNAPDTGNMETIERFGSEDQKKQWLEPLLNAEIRSSFAMTEYGVASSDATNISTRIEKLDDGYRINGHKWWSSGAPNEHCKLLIVMGRSFEDGPRHASHSMLLVPKDTPGITIKRQLTLFNYDDAPHGHSEIIFDNVKVPPQAMLVGEGKGFEIAQGRLGPGRIHHCMRLVGAAERAIELMCQRVQSRVAFGRPLAVQGVIRENIAEARLACTQARLLPLLAADRMDKVGNRVAHREISMIKVAATRMATNVMDRAIQLFGAEGISQDQPLAYMYARARDFSAIE
jgi:acyl-CoA dehydrogenase